MKPLTVGFKNTYNTITYLDESVASASDTQFEYVPEIVGDYNPDDFWLEVYAHDKDEQYTNYAFTISGGSYSGNYVLYVGPSYPGKYVYQLTPKGTNPNVTASPSKCYVTVNKASTNLEWDASSPIVVEVGQKVDLGISYHADIYCTFDTSYDNTLIELSSENETSISGMNDPHWYATGLKEGTTNLRFGIECSYKNTWGYYNFYDSSTLSKTIKVVPATGISEIHSDNNGERVIYDLQGRRLSEPQKGINIINGKKVFTQ